MWGRRGGGGGGGGGGEGGDVLCENNRGGRGDFGSRCVTHGTPCRNPTVVRAGRVGRSGRVGRAVRAGRATGKSENYVSTDKPMNI
jgi:hypothetical protein